MNASDIVKAKQSRVLYQAYYRPTIFPSHTTSTINYCPISTLSTNGTIVSSFNTCTNTQYQYICEKPIISYELANSINEGKYICGSPYCSTISVWNTGQIYPAGVCDCKISFLTWKNRTPTTIHNYSTVNFSTVTDSTTSILTGPMPVICPLAEFYQGTNFDNKCGNQGCC